MKMFYSRKMVIASALLVCAGLLFVQWRWHFINFTGLLEVLGGTLGAAMLGRSPRAVWTLLCDLPRRMRAPTDDKSADIEFFLDIAGLYRQGSVQTAEHSVRILADPILRGGVHLVLDRTPREDLVRLLQWKSGALREHDQAEIQILRTLMMLAPAFGMLGTLFGMVQMLNLLDHAGLQQVGGAIGFALWSTVYGLVLANLFVKPAIMRLEQQARERRAWECAFTEAVLMMHDRRNPGLIREYLQTLTERPYTPLPHGRILAMATHT